MLIVFVGIRFELRCVIDDFDVYQLTHDGGLVIGQELVRGSVVNHKTPTLDGVENIPAGYRGKTGYISIKCCNHHFGCGWIEECEAAAGFCRRADFSAIVGTYSDLPIRRNFNFVVIAIGDLKRLGGCRSREIDHG